MDLVERGRQTLLALFVLQLFSDAVYTAAALYTQSGDFVTTLLQGFFSLLVMALLDYFLYRGFTWARVIALIFLGLGTLRYALAFLGTPSVFLGAMALPNIALFFALLISKAIRDYLAFRRGKLE